MFEQCIKTLLNNCSVSPLKADGYHEKDKRKYGKRKLKETNDVAECSLKKVLKLDQNVDLSEDLEILMIIIINLILYYIAKIQYYY